MKRTKIIDVLQSTQYGKEVCVKGWVRTHRSSKSVDFIALNDGSTIKNVQIVVDPTKFDDELLKQAVSGSSNMESLEPINRFADALIEKTKDTHLIIYIFSLLSNVIRKLIMFQCCFRTGTKQ